MTRLVVRKKTAPFKARPIAKTKTKVVRKATTKKTIQKKAASKKVVNPIYVPRIETFLKNVDNFIKVRNKKFGANDNVAKTLKQYCNVLNREIKKANIINPNMTKTLIQTWNSYKGLSSAPKTLRLDYNKLVTFLCDCVRKDAINLLGNLKKVVNPFYSELKKLDQYFVKELKKANKSKIQYKIDPKMKVKFNSLNTNIVKFKTKWYTRLNAVSLNGDKNVQSAVKALKKEIDELQKYAKKNLVIINRYAKAVKPKKGYKTAFLFNASQLKVFESKWKCFSAEFEKCRIQTDKFCDQLKAIKLWK